MVLSKRFSPIQTDSFRNGRLDFYFAWPISLSPSLLPLVSQTDYSTDSSSEIFLSFLEAFVRIVRLSISPPVLFANKAGLCHTLLMSFFFFLSLRIFSQTGFVFLASLHVSVPVW